MEAGVSIGDLAKITLEKGEPVEDYIARFKNAKIRCHLNLPESELVSIVQKGLSFPFRKKFEGQYFPDFVALSSTVVAYERCLAEASKSIHRYYANYANNTNECTNQDEEPCDVAMAEFVQGPPFKCPQLVSKKSSQKKDFKTDQKREYTFDVKKCDEIFDWLLKFKKIKLVGRHKERDPNEIKGKIYYKWHYAFSHKTSDCVSFRNRIQDEIDKGNIDFPDKALIHVK